MAETQTHTRLAADPQMPRAGSIVGQRYEIQRVLGEGGFAVVYSAYDARTKALVAIKVLDPIMSRRTEFASRFMREIETASRLRHHNSIRIFDAGETAEGCLYLVMELLEGEPLDTVLEESGALPAERVRTIAVQVLKSLQEAHSRGIIHRDLKPANVFIADVPGETDYVKVLDFGIAKSLDESQDTALTATGQVMCSPHYVAPERVKEHLTVPASDLYSLGVMMIELLEGAPPYQADTPMMLAVKHLSAEPVPMGPATLAAPFADVIARACAKPLDERYESAVDMLDDLLEGSRPGAAGSIVSAMPAAATEPAPKSGRTVSMASRSGTGGLGPADARSRRLVVGIVSAFVALGLVLALAIVRIGGGHGPRPEGPIAAPAPVAAVAPPALVPVARDGTGTPLPTAAPDVAVASDVAAATVGTALAGAAVAAQTAGAEGVVAAAEAQTAPEAEATDRAVTRTSTSRNRERTPERAPTSDPEPEPDARPEPPASEPVLDEPVVEAATEAEPVTAPTEPEPDEPRRRIRTNVAPIQ